jgi:hypothetical protein
MSQITPSFQFAILLPCAIEFQHLEGGAYFNQGRRRGQRRSGDGAWADVEVQGRRKLPTQERRPAFSAELTRPDTKGPAEAELDPRIASSGTRLQAARSRFSRRFIKASNAQSIRLFSPSDKHKLLLTRARSKELSPMYLPTSAWRSAAAPRRTIWRWITEQVFSTLDVKW